MSQPDIQPTPDIMPSANLRILIADDHPLVRKGLKEILRDGHEAATIGEADRGDTALAMALAEDWDVVILDISMPGASGLEVLEAFHPARPAIPVIMLSMHANTTHVTRALRLGALGYVSKEAAPDELLTALHAVLAGEQYISRNIAASMAPLSPVRAVESSA